MARVLRIIDPNVSLGSPSMKGVVNAWDCFAAQGYTVEVWCWHAETGLQAARLWKLPSMGAGVLGPLQGMVFSMQVMLLHFWLHVVLGRQRPDVIYSVVPYLPFCDVGHAHFSPWDYEARLAGLRAHGWRERLENVAMRIFRLWHDWFLVVCSARRLLVPSKAVAADFSSRFKGAEVVVLPNAFDPTRFNLEARQKWRAEIRKELGYKDGETVFVFVSTGHYRRKGFFLAVEAVAGLLARGHAARLLVVGGKPATLQRLWTELDRRISGWRDWVTFTGSTPVPERYFAAADAFLFPSYSEAFALVEVEAAACGLPLFLTPHHGSEMILEDGQNGRLIPFDPAGISEVLESFVCGRWKPEFTGSRKPFGAKDYEAGLLAALDLPEQTGRN